jgi:hypothetical protein
MPRMHIMTGNGLNTFNVVCHSPTPAGNNSAGISWVTAIANGLKPVTRMAIGNGSGQITSVEATDIAAGNVIETAFQFDDDPNWSAPTRTTQLNLIAGDAVTRSQNELAAKLKWFGAVVA